MQMLMLSVYVDHGTLCIFGNTLISPFPAMSLQKLFQKNRPSFTGICKNVQFRKMFGWILFVFFYTGIFLGSTLRDLEAILFLPNFGFCFFLHSDGITCKIPLHASIPSRSPMILAIQTSTILCISLR